MKIDNNKFEIQMANSCMSYDDLAKKSNVSSFTISRMQNGIDVKPATVGKIAKALGVRVEELIEIEAATSNQLNRDSENNQN